MTWIALTDLVSHSFARQGIRADSAEESPSQGTDPDEILSTGTLMLEFRNTVEPGNAQTVLKYRRRRDWMRALAIDLQDDGVLVLRVRQGQVRSRAEIRLPLPPRDSRMRISYSWNAPARLGRLTVELLDLGQLFQTSFDNPLPLPLADIKDIVVERAAARFNPAIEFVAVSDAVEPVGFGNGVVGNTWVETPDGTVPVERLRLGDKVITATSGVQSVRWIGKREVPAIGSLRPVRLRAPFFGVERDVLLAPEHRLRLDFADADYMLGTDDVLLSAAHLVNGKQARYEDTMQLVTYYQVLLDVHDCLLHQGIWAESLFIGTLRRRPDVAATTVLGDLPASALPEHRAFSHHRLSDVEARSLVATLRA